MRHVTPRTPGSGPECAHARTDLAPASPQACGAGFSMGRTDGCHLGDVFARIVDSRARTRRRADRLGALHLRPAHREQRAGAPAAPRPRATASTVGTDARARGPRRARLQLRHINAWTVLKFSAVLSIALFFVWLIVIGVLFGVLDGPGIIGKINDAVTTINGPGSKPPITATVVFGGAAIIGVVNIVLFIALSTIGSVVYNLCADLVGGVEITLSER